MKSSTIFRVMMDLDPTTNGREICDIAHRILMSRRYNMSQKRVALRRIDDVMGEDNGPTDEQAVSEYIEQNS